VLGGAGIDPFLTHLGAPAAGNVTNGIENAQASLCHP
jgi:hypothetical protein